MRRYYMISFFYALFFCFSPHPAFAVLWNKVIAVYNKNVLTLWEVEREIQIERVKMGRSLLLEMSQNDLKVMAKKMIVELLVIEEAMEFNVAKPNKKEIEIEHRKFRNQFKTIGQYEAFLKEHHLEESELKKILSRAPHVEQFIKQKALSAYVYLKDEDIIAYREAHKGISWAEAKNGLRKKIVQQNLNDWIQSLKLRNPIQTLWE